MEGLAADRIFEIVGMISACSFIIIAVGDFLSRSMDIIVTRVFAPKETMLAKQVVFTWGLLKALYEEFRAFLDKLSAYSRPRGAINAPLKEEPKK